MPLSVETHHHIMCNSPPKPVSKNQTNTRTRAVHASPPSALLTSTVRRKLRGFCTEQASSWHSFDHSNNTKPHDSTMAEDEEIAALVIDNGSGMCKGRLGTEGMKEELE
jgi:hypothetical protein